MDDELKRQILVMFFIEGVKPEIIASQLKLRCHYVKTTVDNWMKPERTEEYRIYQSQMNF